MGCSGVAWAADSHTAHPMFGGLEGRSGPFSKRQVFFSNTLVVVGLLRGEGIHFLGRDRTTHSKTEKMISSFDFPIPDHLFMRSAVFCMYICELSLRDFSTVWDVATPKIFFSVHRFRADYLEMYLVSLL